MDSNPKTSPPSRELLLKLRRALESKEKADEAGKLAQLSQVALNEWHDNKAAVDFLLQALTIQQQIDDKPAQIGTLSNIAQLYQGWGDNAMALDFLGQVLTLQRQTNDEAGAQATLESMAKIEAPAKGAAPAPEKPAAPAARPQPVEEKPAAPAPRVQPFVEEPAAPVRPVEVKPVKPALSVPPAAPSVEAVPSPAGTGCVLLTFGSGKEKLTPRYVQAVLLPLVAALGELQQVLGEIQGQPAPELIIRSISQDAPIRASLEGVTQAVELVQELVAPWRQENAEQMAKLDEQQMQAEMGRIRVELLEKRAAAAQNQAEAEKLTAEAAKLQADVDRLLQAVEKIRQALYRAKVELALEVLSQTASRLGEVERVGYMIKLLTPLEKLVTSELAIGVQ